MFTQVPEMIFDSFLGKKMPAEIMEQAVNNLTSSPGFAPEFMSFYCESFSGSNSLGWLIAYCRNIILLKISFSFLLELCSFIILFKFTLSKTCK